MFSITQKPQESVNAEDLESIQNELERCLVEVVTQKWELEQEVAALSCTSPDVGNSSLSAGTNIAHSSSAHSSGATSVGGKLKSSLRSSVVEASSENSSDGFKGNALTSSTSSCNNNNNGNTGETASGTNSNEDSVSSEESLVSSLTSSTIITANLSELGSQPTQSNSASGTTSGIKRSHRSSNDRPSKRFRQNSSNSLNSSVGGYPKRLSVSKHRSKIVPVSIFLWFKSTSFPITSTNFLSTLHGNRPNSEILTKNLDQIRNKYPATVHLINYGLLSSSSASLLQRSK